MKREGVGREIERGRHGSRTQTFRSRLYEQAKHVEPIILSECCQSSHGSHLFHNSTNIELFVIRQCIWPTVEDEIPHPMLARRPCQLGVANAQVFNMPVEFGLIAFD